MPAPSIASDKAKQFASFSQNTSFPSALRKSFWKGFFSNQLMLGTFLTNPVWGEWTPGWQTPIGSSCLNSCSNCLWISLIEVIIWDIDENEAKKALEKVNSENLTYQIVDVSNYETINSKLSEIENSHGKIDIFVNNAGVAGMNTTVEEYPIEEWNKVIKLNLNAVFYCCKAVVPFMSKNDYGRIVNIASIAGKEGNPNASAYSTSKAGVIGLTKSLGKELAQKNIAVNCVTPAAAKTRIFDQMTEEHINYMLSKIPRNKFAKVEELASLVTWLASEENSFSTAAVFDLSGGRATY